MSNIKVIEFLKLFPDSFIVLLDDKKKHEPIYIGNKMDYAKAKRMNEKGYGVFFTPNGHKSGWKKDNLTKINSWYVDIDNGNKIKQKDLIKKSPLKPSVIIESKRGFHLYWFSIDGTESNFSDIADRLIYYFNSDQTTKKTNQLLRLPYFKHNKTIKSFRVKLISINPNLRYSESEIIASYPKREEEITQQVDTCQKNIEIIHTYNVLKSIKDKQEVLFSGGAHKEKSMYYLEELSGTELVNYERYTFKLNHNGTYQIIVNSKPSSCWLRQDGSIGSHSGGGPTIIQWINWFK